MEPVVVVVKKKECIKPEEVMAYKMAKAQFAVDRKAFRVAETMFNRKEKQYLKYKEKEKKANDLKKLKKSATKKEPEIGKAKKCKSVAASVVAVSEAKKAPKKRVMKKKLIICDGSESSSDDIACSSSESSASYVNSSTSCSESSGSK